MARNRKRINLILKELQTFWENNPDLRFGQIVVSVLGVDPFYVEDDTTLEKFKTRNEVDTKFAHERLREESK